MSQKQGMYSNSEFKLPLLFCPSPVVLHVLAQSFSELFFDASHVWPKQFGGKTQRCQAAPIAAALRNGFAAKIFAETKIGKLGLSSLLLFVVFLVRTIC